MSRRLTVTRWSVVPLFLGLIASGCTCRGSGLNSNFGAIGVVWKDADGNEIVNRDATYNFGKGTIGLQTPLTLKVRNTGPGSLRLTTLEVTDGDPVQVSVASPVADAVFDVRFSPTTIQTSNETTFQMFFTPNSVKSTFEAKLLLTAEGTRTEDSTAIITLKADGEKGACDLPDVIDFGKVPVGESYPYTIEYSNPTSSVASGFRGEVLGEDQGAFTFDLTAPSGTFEVPPKTITKVTLYFSPAEMRAYSAETTLRGAGPCPEKTVIIKGQGSDERLSWTPDTLNFGFVNPSSEAVREVIFNNPSSVPLTITNIMSPMANDFGQKVATGADKTTFTIPPGEGRMPVACTPTTLGPRSSTLSFLTGIKSPSSGIIKLNCTGGGPKIKVTPRPSVGFGRVGFFPGNATFNVKRKITVQNVGSRPNPPDPTANLFLGEIVNGMPGQGSPYDLVADPGTDPDEFQVVPANNYDQTNGIEATPGKNFLDLMVILTPKSIGTKSAKVTIFSNDPSEPQIEISLTADVQQLPPCNYKVSPAQADFGLVTPGTSKDLPISITNLSVNAGDLCYISGVDLSAGTAPAFEIVGGPVVEKELQPQETWQVVVRLTPPGPVPATLTALLGTLQFNASSATAPQTIIPLKAAIGPSCIAVTPDPMDFGVVRIGCNSSSRTFNVYNTCSQQLTITGVTLQAPGGQAPGGPQCAGTQSCPEFFLTATPPASTVLHPSSAPATFSAKYRPIDVGSDSGAIAINVIQSGQSISYLVGLKGTGDMVGQQTDTFVQDTDPKADILLVIDDSCSMEDKQTNLANNFASFIQYAASASVDYQIGITTTTVSNGSFIGSVAPGGILRRDNNVGPILTPKTPNVATQFGKLVNVGTNGDGLEQGLETAVLALTPPKIANENAGFLRVDANLAVVMITDAEDQSSQAVSYYQNRLVNVKGFNRLSSFTFNGIVPMNKAVGNCVYDDPSITTAPRYGGIVAYSGGVQEEICNPSWATALQGLGKTAFGFRTQFFLGSTPDLAAAPISVLVDGQAVPAANYTYDAAANSVNFTPLTTPPPGKTLTVTYKTVCF